MYKIHLVKSWEDLFYLLCLLVCKRLPNYLLEWKLNVPKKYVCANHRKMLITGFTDGNNYQLGTELCG